MCLNSGSSTSGHEDATIVEIHVVLCNFVSSNPKAWAPIISTWSLELLGNSIFLLYCIVIFALSRIHECMSFLY